MSENFTNLDNMKILNTTIKKICWIGSNPSFHEPSFFICLFKTGFDSPFTEPLYSYGRSVNCDIKKPANVSNCVCDECANYDVLT